MVGLWSDVTGEVDYSLRLLRLTRECGFPDLEAQIERDLAALSTLLMLCVCRTDGVERKRYAELARRIGKETSARRWTQHPEPDGPPERI
jgi:hypothetical protein